MQLSRYVLELFAFFFNDPSTTEIYTLSLHDALPISARSALADRHLDPAVEHLLQEGLALVGRPDLDGGVGPARSEEHTSELQSRRDLVCRLLLEKKKTSREIIIEHT